MGRWDERAWNEVAWLYIRNSIKDRIIADAVEINVARPVLELSNELVESFSL